MIFYQIQLSRFAYRLKSQAKDNKECEKFCLISNRQSTVEETNLGSGITGKSQNASAPSCGVALDFRDGDGRVASGIRRMEL